LCALRALLERRRLFASKGTEIKKENRADTRIWRKIQVRVFYYLQPVNNSFGVGGRELADLLQRESIHVKYHIRSGNLKENESGVYYFLRQTTKEL
jgi:hypothetical protein